MTASCILYRLSLTTLLISLIVLSIISAVCASNPADKLRPLPYPNAPLPSGSMVIAYDTDSLSPDDVLLLLSLQGQVARLNSLPALNASSSRLQPPPLLYHVSGSNKTSPEFSYWSAYKQQLPSVAFVEAFQWTAMQILQLLAPGCITGAYLVALHTDSINIGVSLAGVTDGAVLVTEAHLPSLKALNISVIKDLRQMTETQFVDMYVPSSASAQHRHGRAAAVLPWPFSTRFLSCQLPDKAVTSLSDWTMLIGAMQVQQTDSYHRLLEFLRASHPSPLFNAVFGWVTLGSSEHDYTGNASAAGAGVLASDWLNNGATHSFLTAGWTRPISNPTKTTPQQQHDNRGKHTAAFVFTDGDNICSDLNLLLDAQHWAHPQRGSIPIGWGINPTLALTAAVGLHSYYQQADPANDGFVAFSAQYAFPDDMPDGAAVQQWAELTAEAMAAADLRVMNFIGNNFSGRAWAPLLQQWNVDGCIYFTYYGNYVLPSPENGSVQWVEGKPCISVRQALWQDHTTPESIAAMLNNASRDSGSVDGYSVIAVHIWSETVDSLLRVASLLHDDVLLVKPDELVQLMTQQVQH